MTRITRGSALAGLLLTFVLPGVAAAHVTLQPTSLPAGQFTRVDVRVPNERDDAATTKVDVKFPAGFIFISYEPVPGWKTTVKMAELDTPVEVFGEEHTEQVDTVTFETSGKGIAPGQFLDFGLSLRMPEQAGRSLTFKALQTYDSGEVVRWIGPPDSEEPAPQVTLTTAQGEASAAHTPAVAPTDQDDGGLSLIALILGGAGLLVGAAGLATARRRTAPATS